MALIDSHGRTINYLRLSVTDRCNLRCSYCMPAGGVKKRGHDDILSYEELYLAARAAVAVGVEKIRITGGEPLVRKGITGFLARLAEIPGLKRLVLTTNGILLKEMAADLRDAGVESLNISLDSLVPDTFSRITRGGELRRVLEGIEAAECAGFSFIKINCVVMRGVNDAEVADFAALTLDRPYRVRFIEYMPTLQEEGWQSLTVPGEELLARLGERFQILPADREELAGPATYYRIAGGAGKIGVITPVSCHFCSECNRMRITSTGVAKSCLFAGGSIDLQPLIKKGDEAALREALRRLIAEKPKRHSISAEATDHAPMAMSQVGG
jgi:GTP 3',8-cyclase